MSKLLEVVALALMILVVLLLFFLFQGEPDIWDKLRERAMQTTQCEGKP